jgi:hypothetical protein
MAGDERASPKGPSLGSLIPIVTGLIALIGAVAYAIMRYSYQQFYDQFGLTPDDVGPSSAAALTQSGIRVATFVTLFAVLPLAFALAVSQLVARVLRSDYMRLAGTERRGVLPWLRILLDLLLPVVAAVTVYRLFTAFTSGSRELTEQIVVGIGALLLTGRRYGVSASRRLPGTPWIATAVLTLGGALVLAGSLPRDARKTARCVIDHRLPVRWVHTHRTFFWIDGLSHNAVLQARADPAQMFLARKLSPKRLPHRGPARFVYLGDAGGRDFVFDRAQRETLQIPDGSVVIVTRHDHHCHWWEYKS